MNNHSGILPAGGPTGNPNQLLVEKEIFSKKEDT